MNLDCVDADSHLRRIIALHTDPESGSPYWRERERELGYRLVDHIHTIANLPHLGPFDLEALRTRPYTDFVPRSVLENRQLVFAETGGATGIPATTAYSSADFDAAFVQPFIDCVPDIKLFGDGHWLMLGPSGPHAIGKAAQRIARITSGTDAFTIDFDPRWYRRLSEGSLARTRYLEHVLEQGIRIIEQQDIRFLFATPVVLLTLIEQMSAHARATVRFVYLGGMAIDSGDVLTLADALPAATFLSGYGNTLFGVTHEHEPGRPAAAELRHYYPVTPRLLLRVVPPPAPGLETAERLFQDVAYGDCGQVVMSRIDASGFLPNVMERDDAMRTRGHERGDADGIADPRTPEKTGLNIDKGIY